MEAIRLYTTRWCSDCWRTKQFLNERGVLYEEVDVDEDPEAEELILRVNEGAGKYPPLKCKADTSPAAPSIPSNSPRS